MNAVEVISQIEGLSADEQGKVIDYVRHLEQKRFEDEHVGIALQRLEDLEQGRDEEIPHDEAMRQLRQIAR
ncbi:MAG: hypothetical protein ACOC3I_00365 [Verrucomicrobiota bacterium]